MTRALADTSILIALESGRGVTIDRVPDELAVSIVTVAELRAGVLVASSVKEREQRLDTLTHALALDPIQIDLAVAESWTGLRVLLLEAGMRLGANDSWIAATAMAHRLPLVTQDAGYVGIPGLEVISV